MPLRPPSFPPSPLLASAAALAATLMLGCAQADVPLPSLWTLGLPFPFLGLALVGFVGVAAFELARLSAMRRAEPAEHLALVLAPLALLPEQSALALLVPALLLWRPHRRRAVAPMLALAMLALPTPLAPLVPLTLLAVCALALGPRRMSAANDNPLMERVPHNMWLPASWCYASNMRGVAGARVGE